VVNEPIGQRAHRRDGNQSALQIGRGFDRRVHRDDDSDIAWLGGEGGNRDDRRAFRSEGHRRAAAQPEIYSVCGQRLLNFCVTGERAHFDVDAVFRKEPFAHADVEQTCVHATAADFAARTLSAADAAWPKAIHAMAAVTAVRAIHPLILVISPRLSFYRL
jgi:hypothetical protein